MVQLQREQFVNRIQTRGKSTRVRKQQTDETHKDIVDPGFKCLFFLYTGSLTSLPQRAQEMSEESFFTDEKRDVL